MSQRRILLIALISMFIITSICSFAEIKIDRGVKFLKQIQELNQEPVKKPDSGLVSVQSGNGYKMEFIFRGLKNMPGAMPLQENDNTSHFLNAELNPLTGEFGRLGHTEMHIYATEISYEVGTNPENPDDFSRQLNWWVDEEKKQGLYYLKLSLNIRGNNYFLTSLVDSSMIVNEFETAPSFIITCDPTNNIIVKDSNPDSTPIQSVVFNIITDKGVPASNAHFNIMQVGYGDTPYDEKFFSVAYGNADYNGNVNLTKIPSLITHLQLKNEYAIVFNRPSVSMPGDNKEHGVMDSYARFMPPADGNTMFPAGVSLEANLMNTYNLNKFESSKYDIIFYFKSANDPMNPKRLFLGSAIRPHTMSYDAFYSHNNSVDSMIWTEFNDTLTAEEFYNLNFRTYFFYSKDRMNPAEIMVNISGASAMTGEAFKLTITEPQKLTSSRKIKVADTGTLQNFGTIELKSTITLTGKVESQIPLSVSDPYKGLVVSAFVPDEYDNMDYAVEPAKVNKDGSFILSGVPYNVNMVVGALPEIFMKSNTEFTAANENVDWYRNYGHIVRKATDSGDFDNTGTANTFYIPELSYFHVNFLKDPIHGKVAFDPYVENVDNLLIKLKNRMLITKGQIEEPAGVSVENWDYMVNCVVDGIGLPEDFVPFGILGRNGYQGYYNYAPVWVSDKADYSQLIVDNGQFYFSHKYIGMLPNINGTKLIAMYNNETNGNTGILSHTFMPNFSQSRIKTGIPVDDFIFDYSGNHYFQAKSVLPEFEIFDSGNIFSQQAYKQIFKISDLNGNPLKEPDFFDDFELFVSGRDLQNKLFKFVFELDEKDGPVMIVPDETQANPDMVVVYLPEGTYEVSPVSEFYGITTSVISFPKYETTNYFSMPVDGGATKTNGKINNLDILTTQPFDQLDGNICYSMVALNKPIVNLSLDLEKEFSKLLPDRNIVKSILCFADLTDGYDHDLNYSPEMAGNFLIPPFQQGTHYKLMQDTGYDELETLIIYDNDYSDLTSVNLSGTYNGKIKGKIITEGKFGTIKEAVIFLAPGGSSAEVFSGAFGYPLIGSGRTEGVNYVLDYSFENIKVGTYDMYVFMPGFNINIQKDIVINGEHTRDVNLFPKTLPVKVSGRIMKSVTETYFEPIENALVRISETGHYTYTGSDGRYELFIQPGNYHLVYKAQGYSSMPGTVLTYDEGYSFSVVDGVPTTIEDLILYKQSYFINGRAQTVQWIYDGTKETYTETATPLVGATVELWQQGQLKPMFAEFTNSYGMFEFTKETQLAQVLPNKTYKLRIVVNGSLLGSNYNSPVIFHEEEFFLPADMYNRYFDIRKGYYDWFPETGQKQIGVIIKNIPLIPGENGENTKYLNVDITHTSGMYFQKYPEYSGTEGEYIENSTANETHTSNIILQPNYNPETDSSLSAPSGQYFVVINFKMAGKVYTQYNFVEVGEGIDSRVEMDINKVLLNPDFKVNLAYQKFSGNTPVTSPSELLTGNVEVSVNHLGKLYKLKTESLKPIWQMNGLTGEISIEKLMLREEDTFVFKAVSPFGYSQSPVTQKATVTYTYEADSLTYDFLLEPLAPQLVDVHVESIQGRWIGGSYIIAFDQSYAGLYKQNIDGSFTPAMKMNYSSTMPYVEQSSVYVDYYNTENAPTEFALDIADQNVLDTIDINDPSTYSNIVIPQSTIKIKVWYNNNVQELMGKAFAFTLAKPMILEPAVHNFNIKPVPNFNVINLIQKNDAAGIPTLFGMIDYSKTAIAQKIGNGISIESFVSATKINAFIPDENFFENNPVNNRIFPVGLTMENKLVFKVEDIDRAGMRFLQAYVDPMKLYAQDTAYTHAEPISPDTVVIDQKITANVLPGIVSRVNGVYVKTPATVTEILNYIGVNQLQGVGITLEQACTAVIEFPFNSEDEYYSNLFVHRDYNNNPTINAQIEWQAEYNGYVMKGSYLISDYSQEMGNNGNGYADMTNLRVYLFGIPKVNNVQIRVFPAYENMTSKENVMEFYAHFEGELINGVGNDFHLTDGNTELAIPSGNGLYENRVYFIPSVDVEPRLPTQTTVNTQTGMLVVKVLDYLNNPVNLMEFGKDYMLTLIRKDNYGNVIDANEYRFEENPWEWDTMALENGVIRKYGASFGVYELVLESNDIPQIKVTNKNGLPIIINETTFVEEETGVAGIWGTNVNINLPNPANLSKLRIGIPLDSPVSPYSKVPFEHKDYGFEWISFGYDVSKTVIDPQILMDSGSARTFFDAFAFVNDGWDDMLTFLNPEFRSVEGIEVPFIFSDMSVYNSKTYLPGAMLVVGTEGVVHATFYYHNAPWNMSSGINEILIPTIIPSEEFVNVTGRFGNFGLADSKKANVMLYKLGARTESDFVANINTIISTEFPLGLSTIQGNEFKFYGVKKQGVYALVLLAQELEGQKVITFFNSDTYAGEVVNMSLTGDVVLAKRANIFGTVYRDDSVTGTNMTTPAEAVTVKLINKATGMEHARTFTDYDGKYQFISTKISDPNNNNIAITFEVVAMMPGFSEARISNKTFNEGEDNYLPALTLGSFANLTGKITGVVLSGDNSSPLTGITVSLNRFEPNAYSSYPVYDYQNDKYVTAVSGADGKFTFEAVQYGEYSAYIEPWQVYNNKDYSEGESQRVMLMQPDVSFGNIVIYPIGDTATATSEFRMYLRDETTDASINPTVGTIKLTDKFNRVLANLDLATSSIYLQDENSEYYIPIPDLPPQGELKLEAFVDGYYSLVRPIYSGMFMEFVHLLSKSGSINAYDVTFKVLKAGQSTPDTAKFTVPLELEIYGNGNMWNFMIPAGITAEHTVYGLQEGFYNYEIRAQGYKILNARFDAQLANQNNVRPALETVSLTESGIINGKVYYIDGPNNVNVSNVNVVLRDMFGREVANVMTLSNAGFEGTYTMAGIPYGEYNIEVHHPDYLPYVDYLSHFKDYTNQTLTGTNFDIVLDRANFDQWGTGIMPSMYGRIVHRTLNLTGGTSDADALNAEVRLYKPDRTYIEYKVTGPLPTQTLSNEVVGVNFKFDPIEPGSYKLVVTKPEYAKIIRDIWIEDKLVIKDPIVLKKLTGNIVINTYNSETGNALDGVTFEIYPQGQPTKIISTGIVTGGKKVLKNITYGKYEVVTKKAGYHDGYDPNVSHMYLNSGITSESYLSMDEKIEATLVTITGKVYGDAGKTALLTNATVKLKNMYTLNEFSTTTDAEGKYSFAGRSPFSPYQISVTYTGRGQVIRDFFVEKGVGDTKIHPLDDIILADNNLTTITGKIYETDGSTPVKFALVTVLSPSNATTGQGQEYIAMTNLTGQFTIKDVPKDEYYTLIVVKDGYSPFKDFFLNKPNAENSFIYKDILLKKPIIATTISGKLYGGEGESAVLIGGSDIFLIGMDGTTQKVATNNDSSDTTNYGSFKFNVKPNSMNILYINVKGYVEFFTEVFVGAQSVEQNINLAKIEQSKIVSVSGNVMYINSTTGVPSDLSGVQAVLTLSNNEGIKKTFVTGADGKYTFKEIPRDGVFSITLSKSGYESFTFDSIRPITSGDSFVLPLIFMMENAGKMQVIVKDGSNAVVNGAKVMIKAFDETFKAETITDNEGKALFTDVPLNGYSVIAEKTGYSTADSIHMLYFPSEPGSDENPNVNLVIDSNALKVGKIAVSATTGGGKKVSVSLRKIGSKYDYPRLQGASGTTIEYNELSEGAYIVKFEADDHAPEVTTLYVIASQTSSYSVTMSQTVGIISGNVKDSENVAVQGAEIQARLVVAQGGVQGVKDLVIKAYTDTSGNYSFTNLPYGSYTLGANSKNLHPAVIMNGTTRLFEVTSTPITDANVILTKKKLRSRINFTPYLASDNVKTLYGITIDVDNPIDIQAMSVILKKKGASSQIEFTGAGTKDGAELKLNATGNQIGIVNYDPGAVSGPADDSFYVTFTGKGKENTTAVTTLTIGVSIESLSTGEYKPFKTDQVDQTIGGIVNGPIFKFNVPQTGNRVFVMTESNADNAPQVIVPPLGVVASSNDSLPSIAIKAAKAFNSASPDKVGTVSGKEVTALSHIYDVSVQNGEVSSYVDIKLYFDTTAGANLNSKDDVVVMASNDGSTWGNTGVTVQDFNKAQGWVLARTNHFTQFVVGTQGEVQGTPVGNKGDLTAENSTTGTPDGRVTASDIMAVVGMYNKSLGDTGYNALGDLTSENSTSGTPDNKITASDIMAVVGMYNKVFE